MAKLQKKVLKKKLRRVEDLSTTHMNHSPNLVILSHHSRIRELELQDRLQEESVSKNRLLKMRKEIVDNLKKRKDSSFTVQAAQIHQQTEAFKKIVKKKLTHFRTLVLSKHPTHDILRTQLPLQRFRSLVRLGSTTIRPDRLRIELNMPQGAINSGNKLLMKQCFNRANVKTAIWFTANRLDNFFSHVNNGEGQILSTSTGISNLPYPIVSKSLHGSRGLGNTKHNTQAELEQWMVGKNLNNYIFEKFYTYSKEYRIHVTKDGCFYTCRKLIKSDAPEDTWQRHDSVCVWILENNEAFKKPSNWNLIIQDCINAKNALGLDICSFDVMTQGSSKANPEWIIVESQSAPSFGEVTGQKYVEQIDRLLKEKYNESLER